MNDEAQFPAAECARQSRHGLNFCGVVGVDFQRQSLSLAGFALTRTSHSLTSNGRVQHLSEIQSLSRCSGQVKIFIFHLTGVLVRKGLEVS